MIASALCLIVWGGEEARVSRECLDAIKRQLCKLFVIKADLAIENRRAIEYLQRASPLWANE